MTNKIKDLIKINPKARNSQDMKAEKLDQALKANIKRRKIAAQNKNN